jgi:hypothetical protein
VTQADHVHVDATAAWPFAIVPGGTLSYFAQVTAPPGLVRGAELLVDGAVATDLVFNCQDGTILGTYTFSDRTAPGLHPAEVRVTDVLGRVESIWSASVSVDPAAPPPDVPQLQYRKPQLSVAEFEASNPGLPVVADAPDYVIVDLRGLYSGRRP